MKLEPGEHKTTIAGWVVIYPSGWTGELRDAGFIYRENGYRSDIVHFDTYGLPYGPYMPKKVAARLVAMRKRHLKELDNDHDECITDCEGK